MRESDLANANFDTILTIIRVVERRADWLTRSVREEFLPHVQTLWIDEPAVSRERIGPIEKREAEE